MVRRMQEAVKPLSIRCHQDCSMIPNVPDRIATGFISGISGIAFYFIMQLYVVVRVFPKASYLDIFTETKYGLMFGLIMFAVGFVLGSVRVAHFLGLIFSTTRKK